MSSTPNPATITYEQMMALFLETRERQERLTRSMEETDRKFQETDRKIQEAALGLKETKKLVDKVTKNVGGLNRSMGELIETLIAARLWEKFAAYPYNLQRAYQRVPIYDVNNRALTDVDLLLSDTEWVMAVEVKREANMDDIDRHIKRMERVRKYPPAEAKGKKLLGAIAGGIVPQDVKVYAHESGFFILELKGEAVELITPPEGFSPKVW